MGTVWALYGHCAKPWFWAHGQKQIVFVVKSSRSVASWAPGDICAFRQSRLQHVCVDAQASNMAQPENISSLGATTVATAAV